MIRADSPSVLEPPRLTDAGRALLLGALGVIVIGGVSAHPVVAALGLTMLGMATGAWLSARDDRVDMEHEDPPPDDEEVGDNAPAEGQS